VRNKFVTNAVIGAYNLVQKSGILELGPVQRAFLAASFFYKRHYEDPFWALAQRNPELFRSGDILDVGANIGYTAYVFAHVLPPPRKIFAFEPDKKSFALLTDVLRRKRLLDRVQPHNLAVGSSEGMLEFWHNDAHSADHRVVTPEFKQHHRDSLKVTRVPVTTVDSFVREHNIARVSFIKIDVQGYEPMVCEGMSATLEKFPDVCVCFEYSPDGLRELGFDPAALLSFFRTRGFHIHLLTRAAAQLIEDDSSLDRLLGPAGYADILCTRSPI
jgi:FkbM family methyltransferase